MIQRNNVTEQIIAYCKQQIRSGTWKIGEKSPSENQLCAELGVSRASIRSAIKELTGIGALESVHGKGTFLIDNQLDIGGSQEYKITSEDCKDMEKVLEFRRIIEPEACYLAARNMGEELLGRLEHTLEEMRCNVGDSLRFVEADLQFHWLLSQATDNPLIEKSMNRIFKENLEDHEKMNQVFGYQDGIYYHTMIINAIKAGNPERARGIMHDHLQHGVDRLKKGQIKK